jgi:hypothetical protein
MFAGNEGEVQYSAVVDDEASSICYRPIQSVLDLGLSWQAGGRVTAAWRAYNFKFRLERTHLMCLLLPCRWSGTINGPRASRPCAYRAAAAPWPAAGWPPIQNRPACFFRPPHRMRPAPRLRRPTYEPGRPGQVPPPTSQGSGAATETGGRGHGPQQPSRFETASAGQWAWARRRACRDDTAPHVTRGAGSSGPAEPEATG